MGASIVPRQLQRAFTELGHRCDLLFSEDLGGWPGNERLRFAASPSLALRAVARAWRRHGPFDVVDAVAAEASLIALARRRFPGAALIARSHGLEHLYYRELLADHEAGLLRKPWWRRGYYPLVRLAPAAAGFRRADRAILLNRRERDEVLARGWQPEGRLDLIPHGLDEARLAAAPPPDLQRGAGLLFSGAWYTGKGNIYLARAHALLLQRGLPLPLTLLGPGIGHPQAEVERYVRASFAPASQPHLTVLPRLASPAAVDAHYRRHDLLVCPSTAEGFGMVVFEALSQRLPVVATSAVGATDCLRPNTDACIVPPRDPEALADAIAQLWQNPERRRALAERGHQTVRPYTWRRAAQQTLACYAAARSARLPIR